MVTTEKVEAAQLAERLEMMAETLPLSVAVLDIDEFGRINQELGRAAGDLVIARVGDLLMKEAADAYAARTGGDEFLVAFAGTSPEQALIRMEGIREKLGGLQETQTGLGAVSISVGIASFPHHTEDLSQLPAAAQAAMLRAKAEGRGRVAIYIEEKMILKSNYYSRAQLARLATLAHALGRTEAALLREALVDLLDRHRELT